MVSVSATFFSDGELRVSYDHRRLLEAAVEIAWSWRIGDQH